MQQCQLHRHLIYVIHVYHSCCDHWALRFASCGSLTSNTVLQSIVPDEMRDRIMGIWALMFGGMIPLGSLQACLMADFLDTPATMAIGALIRTLAALLTLKSFAAAKRNWTRLRNEGSAD